MNITTNLNFSQRQLNTFQRSAEMYRRRYSPIETNIETIRWDEAYRQSNTPLETAMWRLEDKLIPAHVVPVTHPTIQYAMGNPLRFTTAASLYGVLRSNVIEHVLLGHGTYDIVGCVSMWNTDHPDIAEIYSEEWYFLIQYHELHRFLNHFLRDTYPPEEKIRWQEEGF